VGRALLTHRPSSLYIQEWKAWAGLLEEAREVHALVAAKRGNQWLKKMLHHTIEAIDPKETPPEVPEEEAPPIPAAAPIASSWLGTRGRKAELAELARPAPAVDVEDEAEEVELTEEEEARCGEVRICLTPLLRSTAHTHTL